MLLYMKGWTLERCINEYEQLAKDIFRPYDTPLLKWVRALFLDALYPSEGMERALESICGNQTIAGMSYASEIGAKFGLLAASVSQPSVSIFTNYNGIGETRSGYNVPRGLSHTEAWKV